MMIVAERAVANLVTYRLFSVVLPVLDLVAVTKTVSVFFGVLFVSSIVEVTEVQPTER